MKFIRFLAAETYRRCRTGVGDNDKAKGRGRETWTQCSGASRGGLVWGVAIAPNGPPQNERYSIHKNSNL